MQKARCLSSGLGRRRLLKMHNDDEVLSSMRLFALLETVVMLCSLNMRSERCTHSRPPFEDAFVRDQPSYTMQDSTNRPSLYTY